MAEGLIRGKIMPFFKCSSGLVYFFHVPKCGGSTIEEALLDKGFKLSFYDTAFWANKDKSYYKSSPQHITNEDFNQLFLEDIFFYKFTMVRDPVSRLLSAYAYNRNKIGRFLSFNKFLSNLEKNVASRGDYFGRIYDNHFVPSSRLVPEDCNIFYFEDNMRQIEIALRNILKEEIDLSHNKNLGKYEKVGIPKSPRVNEISQEAISRIKILYNEDYERFNFK